MNVATVNNLLECLPPYEDQWIVITGKQSVKDIIHEVLDSHEEFKPFYDRIALFFDGDTTEDICKNLYDFLKKNIKYREEKEDDQTTAVPTGILIRGFGDCKHYSTFSGGVLDALNRLKDKGIKWSYRFASYDPFNKNPHHVFVVVKDGNDEIWIDPTPGSDQNTPLWYLDKKVSTMALRRNIAGLGYLEPIALTAEAEQPATDTVYLAPDQLPIQPNEEPSPVYTDALEETQAEEEVTPELQNAIETLLQYGIMNDQGEISDTVLNNLAPTLGIDQFELISSARNVVLTELEKAVTVGSFFSKLWTGVKKVTLAVPRNAYLSLVAINAFGFATKLHNAIYNEDGTYWQPGQQQLYDKWKKLGGTWTNLRNAIESGAKKKALLGQIDFDQSGNQVSPDCLDDYYQSRLTGYYSEPGTVGIAPVAAAAAWYTAAAAIIAALTPLILGILKQRAQANQLPVGIDPNTGFPVGINPGTTPPGGSTSGNFLDNARQWVQDHPLESAVIAAGVVYLAMENPFK